MKRRHEQRAKARILELFGPEPVESGERGSATWFASMDARIEYFGKLRDYHGEVADRAFASARRMRLIALVAIVLVVIVNVLAAVLR